MDFLQLGAEYWEIVVGLIASGYFVKIKTAVMKTKAAIEEVKDTHPVIMKALEPDSDGIVRISKEEAEKIANEIKEDLLAIQDASAHVMSVMPKAVRDRVQAFLKKG